MSAQRILPSPGHLSARQRSVRRRASQLPFKAAVWLAVDALFRFTHRASRAKALWSDHAHAWLGSATFLDWAMGDPDIDIPRIVASTAGSPESADELHEAVHGELIAYWADHLASLPRRSKPPWLPLP
jgi:hypothetical protein